MKKLRNLIDLSEDEILGVVGGVIFNCKCDCNCGDYTFGLASNDDALCNTQCQQMQCSGGDITLCSWQWVLPIVVTMAATVVISTVSVCMAYCLGYYCGKPLGGNRYIEI